MPRTRIYITVLIALATSAMAAQAPTQTGTRAAFLKVIDRTRVPLAPEERAVQAEDGFIQLHITFAADAGSRVTMLLVKSAGATGRQPAVIYLHGTGGNKDQQLNRLKVLARLGFVATAIDARYHGERTTAVPGPAKSAYSNAILRAYQSGGEHPFFFDTVWDVMRTVDYLDTRADVDPARIGLAGFSKGAIETYLAAAAEPRIAAAVAGHGVQSFGWALSHGGWDSRAWTIRDAIDPAAGMANGGTSAAFVRSFYDKVAPGIYSQFDGPAMVPLIAPRPFLIVAGDSDPRTPMAGVRACMAAAEPLYASAGAGGKLSLLVEENVGHEQTPVFDKAMNDWFVRWLASSPAARAAASSDTPVAATPNAARDLRDAIDIHIHASPDENPRSVDAIDAATQAAQHGMRAIVLKNHWDPTAGLAILARKAVPGVDVFGGIDMNRAVGGMNPAAVEHMAKFETGRFVWMPTFDSEAQLKANKSGAPFVAVAKNGELLPDTKAVIAAIAKHDFVLASGNISADEALLVFAEGKRAGVKHMVATHGTASPTLFTIEQAKAAAALGAYIEFAAGSLTGAAGQAKVDKFAREIRAIGPEFCVVSTDLGTRGLALPTDGFALFLEMLRQKGFTNRELDLMSKENPAKLLGLTASAAARPQQASAAAAIPTPNAARDLRGAVDIHVHSNPDSVPRSLDGLEAARQAAAHGMRAIVLKNHYDATSGLAWLAGKQAPGLEVFGGVDLNLPVGGMNANAVDYMAKMNGARGRMVWMSTFDSEAQVRLNKSNLPFVRVSRNGELLPETKAVIAAIARHDFVLASGHVAADEALMLFREGQRAGVKHMVATHGMTPPTSLTVDQAKQAIALGAFIEFCAGTLATPDAPQKIDRFAQQIRAVGPEHVILSSDLGQAGNAFPVDGLAVFYEMLRKKGFTDAELDLMGKTNPAKLLGLN